MHNVSRLITLCVLPQAFTRPCLTPSDVPFTYVRAVFEAAHTKERNRECRRHQTPRVAPEVLTATLPVSIPRVASGIAQTFMLRTCAPAQGLLVRLRRTSVVTEMELRSILAALTKEGT